MMFFFFFCDIEIWRDIEGYVGFYQVSNMGRVRSVSHNILMKNGVIKHIKNKILKLHEGGNNTYLQAYLHKDNTVCNKLVHRLVVATFQGTISRGLEVNHINGNKHDNRLCNLEIVTSKENSAHAIRTGLFNPHGEHQGGAKLTNKQAAEIREIYRKGGVYQKDLAALYRVSQHVIFKIVNNISYIKE